MFLVYPFLLFDERFSYCFSQFNSAQEEKKRFELYELNKIKKIDILFIQETHNDASNEVDWARQFDVLTFFSHKGNSIFTKRTKPF